MIMHWDNADDDTCPEKNEYEDEFDNALEEFISKYGIVGQDLRTEEEKISDEKHHCVTGKFIWDMPEYKELSANYFAREDEIDAYKQSEKKKALEMLVKYFEYLWD